MSKLVTENGKGGKILMSKLAIVGSRGFNNYKLMKEILDPYLDKIYLIVSGGARGADSLAQLYAKQRGLPIMIFYPDYEKYGKKAPLIRNGQIVEFADKMIAFPIKGSRGTWHAIKAMQSLEKPYRVINSEEVDNEFTK
jgi:hypothetical protein